MGKQRDKLIEEVSGLCQSPQLELTNSQAIDLLGPHVIGHYHRRIHRAFAQPAQQISRLRGKPSSRVLAQLVRRGLLSVRRMDDKRRTAQYFTTDRFLRLFGMERLDDLPQSEELDRL